MGEMASQQERLQLVEAGQPKHGEGETSSQREKQAEGPLGGNCLMPACTAPVQMMSPAPHSFPSTLRSSLPVYQLDSGSGTGYYPVFWF